MMFLCLNFELLLQNTLELPVYYRTDLLHLFLNLIDSKKPSYFKFQKRSYTRAVIHSSSISNKVFLQEEELGPKLPHVKLHASKTPS